MASPANDVWYSFTAPANGFEVNIVISGAGFTPNIALWSGGCSGLTGMGCTVGSAGSATLTVSGTTPGQTYLIQVSGNTGQTGNFNIAVNAQQDCANCNLGSTITVSPLPVDGVYSPGQTVQFCYHIADWSQVNANWLHGVVFNFGAGWNLATLTYTAPASCSGTGTWAYYPTGQTSSASGVLWPAGFYYETNSGSTCACVNTDPGDNYGDNCQGVQAAGTWDFCVSIKVENICNPGANLSVSVTTSGDGESGSWTNSGCVNDPATNFVATAACCPPTVSAISECVGQTIATATAVPTGTVSPYTYVWQNSSGTTISTQTNVVGTSTVSGLAVGIYTVIVTDANSCAATATVSVDALPTPSVIVNSATVCASSNSATLTVSGATSYTWAPITNLSITTGSMVVATPTSTTVYTVTGSSGGGCMSSETATVTVDSVFNINVNSAILCFGASDTLKATGVNTYTWLPSAGLSVATGSAVVASPTTTTVYTVTGTMGTCSVTPATSTITVVSSLAVTVNSTSICIAGGSGVLTANGASTYTWIPATGLSATTGSMVTATPTVNSTYTVVGTSGTCSSTATSTVTLVAIPNFTVNSGSTCLGQPIALIGSNKNLTYSWTPASTITTSATTDTAYATPLTTTIYTVTGALGSCISLPVTDSVKVIPSPTVTVLSPTVCVGTTATITATGAISYTWSPLTNLTSTTTNDTVFINNPTAPASYTVMGMAANGCISSAVSQVDTSNHLGVLSGSPQSRCFGSYVGLTAVGASTYTWTSNDPVNLDFGADTSWFVSSSVANVGTYTIAIYGESHSGHYCNGRDTVILTINPTPTVTTVLSPTTAICSGSTATITASGATTYTWISPSTTSLTPTPNVFIDAPTFTTTYTVNGSNAFGCTSSAVATITVTPTPSFTVNSPVVCFGGNDSIKVSPNTATSYSWSVGLSATTGTVVTFNANTVGTNTYSVFATDIANSISCFSPPVTLTVTVNPLPVITVSVNPISDTVCAGNTATLTSSGAVTYTWTSPSTTSLTPSPNVFIDAPTVTSNYTVSGSNTFGCVNSATANIVVNNAPTFTYTGIPSFALCKGATDTIEVISTYTNSVNPSPTYSWTAPINGGLSIITNTFVTVTPTGTVGFGGLTYTLTATSGSCSVTHHIHVQVHNPPVLNPAPDTAICSGNSVTLNANPVGGFGGGNTYTWTPLSINTSTTTTNVSPSATSSYTVQATSGFGCVSIPYILTVSVTPTPSFSVNNAAFCLGGSDTLKVVPIIPATDGYVWTPGTGLSATTGTSVVATPTTVGANVYTIIGSNTANGITCPSAALSTVMVNNAPLLKPTPLSDTIICSGNPVVLNANPQGGSSNNTYTWTPIGVNSVATTVSPTTTTSATVNMYSVQATNTVTGCQSPVMTVTVTVEPEPTVNASVNNPLCTGQAIDLTSTVTGSPTTYSWSSSTGYSSSSANPVIPNASLTNNGTYTVTVSLGSCAATSVVIVNVNNHPTIITSTATAVCPNKPVTYTATGTANSFTWSPVTGVTAITGNESVVSIVSASSNTYVVTGIDTITGCTSTKTVTLNVDPITASFVPSTEVGVAPLSVSFTNTSVSGTPTNTYTWNYGNDSTYVTTNINDPATHTTYTAGGTYNVILTAANSIGCTHTVSATIVVTESYSLTIPNIFTPNGDGINEYFMVKAEGVSSINILIYDRWGLKMFESSSVTGAWDGKNMGGKEVPEDTYFYIINATDNKGNKNNYKGFITLLK